MDGEASLSAKAVRWLEIGRDVLVRCEDGAQGTAFLGEVSAEAELHGLVTRRLGPEDLDTDLDTRAAWSETRQARQERVLHSAGQAVLLVEDVGELSPAGAKHLARILRRSRALLVTTTAFDLVRRGGGGGDSGLGRLVADRGPGELRIPALGYSEMMAHVDSRLGGSAEARLVSSLLAWSAGLPSVASALLDAGRYVDAIRLVGGVWTMVGDLSTIPLDPVALLLCARLSAPEVTALTTLSVLGPMGRSEFQKVADFDVLERLLGRHRVIAHSGPSGTLLSVSPPALASALRSRAMESGADGLDLGRIGDCARPCGVPEKLDILGLLLSSDAEQCSEFKRRASAIMTMTQEASQCREEDARGRWQRSHGLEDAVAYLSILLQRPTRQTVGEVFESTVTLPGTGLMERFQLLRLRWLSWLGEHPEREASTRQHQHGEESIERINQIIRTVLQSSPTPRGDAELAAAIPLSASAEEPVRSLAYAYEATALLESGRFDLALHLAAPGSRPEWLLEDLCTYLDGIYHETLLALGRTHESFMSSRAHLARALNDLDPTGIRVYAVGLAQSLIVMGMAEAAGTLLFTVLRLGPAGPVGDGFYQRLLILAAAHTACAETAGAGRLLAEELVNLPTSHMTTLNDPREMAKAHLSRLDAKDDEADTLLWDEGRRSVRQGRLHSALLAWSQLSSIPTPEQMKAIRTVAAARPAPLMARFVAVQEALSMGDVAEVIRTSNAAPMSMSPPLAETVLEFVDEQRRKAGDQPLSHAERGGLVGGHLARWLEGQSRNRRTGVLSAREREIALLAAEGRSNQEIATLLGVSRRTIENHVHRSLKKLRLACREDFRTVSL